MHFYLKHEKRISLESLECIFEVEILIHFRILYSRHTFEAEKYEVFSNNKKKTSLRGGESEVVIINREVL